jgi:hypothetical protein
MQCFAPQFPSLFVPVWPTARRQISRDRILPALVDVGRQGGALVRRRAISDAGGECLLLNGPGLRWFPVRLLTDRRGQLPLGVHLASQSKGLAGWDIFASSGACM